MHCLDSQPKYIKIMIFSNLSIRDLYRIAKLNRKYNQFIKDNNWPQSIDFGQFFDRMDWTLSTNKLHTDHIKFNIMENNQKYLMADIHYFLKKEKIDKININTRVEYLLIKQLNKEFNIPYIRTCYLSFCANIKKHLELVCDSLDKDEYYYDYYKNELPNCLEYGIINIHDLCEYGTLHEYININNGSIKLEIWKTLLFQILYTLAVIQEKYPSFRHNDFRPSVIYLKKNPTTNDYDSHYLDGQHFLVKNVGLQICINESRFSCMGDIVKNNLIDEKWVNDLNITPVQHRYYDLHYFFSHLLRYFDKAIPAEIINFIQRIIPDKYNMLNKNYIFVNSRGRLLVNDEYITPRQIIMHDDFFAEYRV